MKVLVSDNISLKGVEILKKAGLEVDVKTGLKPEELKACIGEYHGLVIRSATKVTSEIIDAAINLKVIGTGLQSPVDLKEAPDGTGRLFIVEQTGTIRVVMPDGTMRPEAFLDLREKIV